MTKRSWRIIPKTALGWWSVGLIIAMPILFFIGTSLASTLYDSVAPGGSILGDISARPALALLMIAGVAAGISSFITGLLAIIRQKEYTLLVFVSSVIGALVGFLTAGILLFPE